MPNLLRCVRRNRWIINPEVLWPDEALKDLRPGDDGKLSVWHVEDDHSNLNRIIAALAAGRKELGNFDYLLIDYDIISLNNLSYECSVGHSPDAGANAHWHRDLLDCTELKRRVLADAILASSSKPKRLLHKEVTSLICHHIVAGHIDREKMDLNQRNTAIVQGLIESNQF